jgi:hypothetical protein
MIVAQGLGRPGGLLVSGGLGRGTVSLDTFRGWIWNGTAYIEGLSLRAKHSSGWIEPVKVYKKRPGGWVLMWE